MDGKKRLFLAAFALALSLAVSGCDYGESGAGNVASSTPDTSTIADRKAALEAQLKMPRERKPGEITISFSLRPVFVLHLNDKLRVVSFEALNKDAHLLKTQNKQGWKRKRYPKAVRNIVEWAIIDGFISDNNPNVSILVEQESIGDLDERAIEEIKRTVLDEAEQVVELHGISADIELAE